MEKTNDFDRLLLVVMEQARAAGVPVSPNTNLRVLVNTRAKKRFGRCIKQNGRYTIELSSVLLSAPERSCRQTLAHELIHTCKGCDNHGRIFKKYANIMNLRYGYSIKCTNTAEEMGIPEELRRTESKYVLRCVKCGRLIGRIRYSAVIADPSRYRCTCGGKLERIR